MRAVPKIGLLTVCIALLLAGCGGGSKSSPTGSNQASTPTATSTPSTTTSATQPGVPVAAGRPRTDLQSVFEDERVLYTAYASQRLPQAFARFSSLGVQTLRVFVNWNYLAPDNMSYTRPAGNPASVSFYAESYWEYLDAIVEQAQAHHIRVLFDVGAAAPYWALGKHPQTSLGTGGWKPNATLYGDLIQAMGQRYSGHYTPAGASAPLPRVDAWSVWNEPNAIYLTPNAVGPQQTPYAPRLYRALVDAAWAALAKTGHTPRTDTILIGETAPRGQVGKRLPGNTGGLLPLIFIRALYCVSAQYKPLTGSAATTLGCPASGSVSSFRAANPALFEATGWANHPYSDGSPPTEEAKPSAVLPASVIANSTDFASLAQLETGLDRVFTAYGSHEQIPIYSTEYGYITNPPAANVGISDATAAAYMNEAEYLSWLNPRIRSSSQYLLIDPAPGNNFATGLERYVKTPPSATQAGTPKPVVYDAYRMPLYLPRTSASPGAKLEVWGCARPVNQPDVTGRQVDIQFAAAGSSRYATVKTATLDPARAGCYFETSVALRHSGTVRISFDDRGTAITSRTQAVTVS